jgi:hypothetical protein
MTKIKYTREHWDEFQRLVATGLSGASALRELGIPKGSLGALRTRFDGSEPAALPAEVGSPPVPSQSIGELAKMLNNYTEELLDLAAQMSELTKHAHGLALLDDTLGQLEAKQREARGLRKSLEDAEGKLISRAMVVHSND